MSDDLRPVTEYVFHTPERVPDTPPPRCPTHPGAPAALLLNSAWICPDCARFHDAPRL